MSGSAGRSCATARRGYRYRFLRGRPGARRRARSSSRFDRSVRRWWSLFSIDDMVLPAHAYCDAWNGRPTVSGGPFAFEEWTAGLHVRLVRNDATGAHPRRSPGIDVVFVPDDETRLQLLERGELDACSRKASRTSDAEPRARLLAAHGALNGEAGASGAWGRRGGSSTSSRRRLRHRVARAGRSRRRPSDLVAEILEDSGPADERDPADFTSGSGGDRRTRRLTRSCRGAAGEPRRGHGAARPGTCPRRPGPRRVPARVPARRRGRLDRGFHPLPPARDRVTAELVGVEPDTFEETCVPGDRASAIVRGCGAGPTLRTPSSYASAPDPAGLAAVDDRVADAETQVSAGASRPRAGRPASPVTRGPMSQRGLVDAASVGARWPASRTLIVPATGVSGPHAVGGRERAPVERRHLDDRGMSTSRRPGAAAVARPGSVRARGASRRPTTSAAGVDGSAAPIDGPSDPDVLRARSVSAAPVHPGRRALPSPDRRRSAGPIRVGRRRRPG